MLSSKQEPKPTDTAADELETAAGDSETPVIELEDIPSRQPSQAAEPDAPTPELSAQKGRRRRKTRGKTPPKRRKKRLWVLSAVGSLIMTISRFTVVTIILSGIIGYIGYNSLQLFIAGEQVAVPNVCGSDLQTCLVKLQERGLTLELEKRENSEVSARGVVIRQQPSPNSTVKSRTPVKVTVSLGPLRQPIPKVISLNKEAAGIILRQSDFKLGKHSYIYDLRAEKNAVIAQDPPRDILKPKDSRVNLLISLGPPPTEFEMPELLGLTLLEARIVLGRMNLPMPNVNDADRPGVEQGVIVDQTPRPGQSVNVETPITLTQATGV